MLVKLGCSVAVSHPTVLPIPGTTSVEHLHETLAAGYRHLAPADVDAITALVPEEP